MARGIGFKRRLLPAWQSATADGVRTVTAATRRATYAARGAAAAIPKTSRREIPHLLRMALGMPCLFRVRGVCNHNPETTVAAHSNWAQHGGKGGARKADDCYSAWACSCCHAWLDSGPADGEIKKTQFLLAHMDQVQMWREIASGVTGAPAKDRAAAALALEHLNATPVGQGDAS
jgi:hypothetical protein